MGERPKIIIITGPTGSGKTEIGIECAKRFNGEIVSADSMQIYKGLNIGTAKPNARQLEEVPHHLIDIAEPNSKFNVFNYKQLALTSINDILNRNKVPIVVGGTGLYIRSIIQNLSFGGIGNHKSETREKYQNLLDKHGSEYLYNLLQRADPEAARLIHINNTQRVMRALEICETKGKNKGLSQDEQEEKFDYIMFVLDLPREQLYAHINKRFGDMIELGLVQEVKNLIKNKEVTRDSSSMQAIGYKELFDYIDQKITLDDYIETASRHSRNYAKRQLTFFRGFKKAIFLDPSTQKKEIFEKIKEFLGEKI